ncbi:MAG: hypothetical protein KGL39_20030 [Patescibacteria group bacterium]|nr:hypothetical protein [Patescibacteria group bacterium]
MTEKKSWAEWAMWFLSGCSIVVFWWATTVSGKVDDHEKRLSTVEQAQKDMAGDVLEVKDDVKEILRRVH